MDKNKLKRWGQNLLLIFGGLFIGVVVMEIGLRLAGISYPVFKTTDEHRGTALRPGASGWQRKEGEAYTKINSDGFRDREYSQTKPENTLRIAVLGDSFTEGMQLPMEKTFVTVMESELKECKIPAGKTIEAMNFGVGGYGTAQQLLTLRHRVWKYSPDIVVLAIFTGNDIKNNSRELDRVTHSPYFIYRDGELVVDNSFRNSRSFKVKKALLGNTLSAWLINNSRVYQVIYESVRNIVLFSLAQQRDAAKDADLPGQELGISDSIYQEPTTADWQEAWRITEELIVLMQDEVKQKKAEFLVVTLSTSIQVHPDQSVRQEFMNKSKIADLFYPDRRIKTLGEREGFRVLNLAPPLQTYAEEKQTFLHGFKNTPQGKGHWNEEGHRIAGQIMAQKICGDYLVEKTGS